jgi:beta-galactosidase
MKGDTTLLDRRQVLIAGAGAALVAPVAGLAAPANQRLTKGRLQPFDADWLFRRGEAEGLQMPSLDDSAWRQVDLPHDWSIENLPPGAADGESQIVGPFDRTAIGGTATGFSVGGEGWYRKRFSLRAPPDVRVEILFEGVYMDNEVWLNGQHLGAHRCGYTPFAYDLSPYLSLDGENVLAVRVRNLGQNSRWYSGSGIYRHVWLDVLPRRARIARWGVGVIVRQIGDQNAQFDVSTRLEEVEAGLTLVAQVQDEHGRVVAQHVAEAAAEVRQAMTIASPRLWSPDTPVLYTLETQLRRDAELLDRTVTPFGVRVVTFDQQHGMAINGVPMKLRGGCIHHDNGLLGAAAFDAAEERKVRLLKARGFNAVRPSHNLFSPAFLHACDRYGVLVVEETFDVWREHKLAQDYATYFDDAWRNDLAAMVLSTRNHPSIILWSIGNEIPERNSAHGIQTQWLLANEVHRLDPSRPVTAAINGFAGQLVTASTNTARPGAAGVADQTSVIFLDVVGYNYKLDDYESDHQRFPNRILFGTESFPKDVAAIWDLTDRSAWLIGDFVWTAMDYLGEAGIGGSTLVAAGTASGPAPRLSTWPWINAFCGDIDLIGQQKPASRARDVVWGLSALEIGVQRPVPDGKVDQPAIWGWHDEQNSWTWPGSEGRALTIRVYTGGDQVELHLNGRLLERKPVMAADLRCVQFTAPYEPGVLEAIASRDGAQIARRRLQTVGIAVAIRLTPERSTGGSARGDVSYVAVEIVDASGNRVPDASTRIDLVISGSAELIAFGSANPVAMGPLQSSTAQTWNGRALAIIRGRGRKGRVTLEAHAGGLKSGTAAIQLA